MTPLTETESKRRLGSTLPTPEEVLAASVAEAEAFCSAIGEPVVAKASGVAHKTEGNLVRLGVTAEAMAGVFEELAAAGDGSVLLARQVKADVELIVGGYRDETFGPVVTVGIGGVAAELFGDIVAILAPPEPGEVAEAVATLRGASLLAGVRGRPPLDIASLEVVVTAVSDLLLADPGVVEIDCNPVMVEDGQAVVVDALVVVV
ncbi:MAG: acetate--CoA ligase family protein [Acidimicrobiia bacterium]|nr:acetate--CoA ligase family protein [Acidimicrobiia bacterium]